MNFKEILELIDKVADRGIAVVEVERAGTKVRIEGKVAAAPLPAIVPVAHPLQAAAAPIAIPMPASGAPSHASPQPPPAPAPPEDNDEGLHVITSPIVGTFYRSPNPESDAFVNVGDRVSKGKVLCIIEAMKLMNEIEADVDGVVAKIFPQNGQPIEYGEKLFAIKS